MIQLLEYQLIFPDERPRDCPSYLIGIDKILLLKLAGHLTRVSLNQEYYSDNTKVLSDWFQRDNSRICKWCLPKN